MERFLVGMDLENILILYQVTLYPFNPNQLLLNMQKNGHPTITQAKAPTDVQKFNLLKKSNCNANYIFLILISKPLSCLVRACIYEYIKNDDFFNLKAFNYTRIIKFY